MSRGGARMTETEACALIGARASEMLDNAPSVKKEMCRITQAHGKDAAVKWLLAIAIATLMGGVGND